MGRRRPPDGRACGRAIGSPATAEWVDENGRNTRPALDLLDPARTHVVALVSPGQRAEALEAAGALVQLRLGRAGKFSVVVDAGLAGRLGVSVPALVVLRPDGFLGWLGPLDLEGLADHFDRLLGPGPRSG